LIVVEENAEMDQSRGLEATEARADERNSGCERHERLGEYERCESDDKHTLGTDKNRR
jgi:hypothetical protein